MERSELQPKGSDSPITQIPQVKRAHSWAHLGDGSASDPAAAAAAAPPAGGFSFCPGQQRRAFLHPPQPWKYQCAI